VLEGEFNVVEVTARGVNYANTFTFHAVVMDELSGVFERVEPESYRALQEVVGGCPVLADLAGPGTDSIGIVFGEDCYDTIVQGMTIKLRNGLKGTPPFLGGSFMVEVDPFYFRVWLPELMSMHFEPLFMNNCRTFGLWTTLVLHRRRCWNETLSWR